MDPQRPPGDNKIFTIRRSKKPKQVPIADESISPADKKIMIIVLILTVLALVTMGIRPHIIDNRQYAFLHYAPVFYLPFRSFVPRHHPYRFNTPNRGISSRQEHQEEHDVDTNSAIRNGPIPMPFPYLIPNSVPFPIPLPLSSIQGQNNDLNLNLDQFPVPEVNVNAQMDDFEFAFLDPGTPDDVTEGVVTVMEAIIDAVVDAAEQEERVDGRSPEPEAQIDVLSPIQPLSPNLPPPTPNSPHPPRPRPEDFQHLNRKQAKRIFYSTEMKVWKQPKSARRQEVQVENPKF